MTDWKKEAEKWQEYAESLLESLREIYSVIDSITDSHKNLEFNNEYEILLRGTEKAKKEAEK